MNEFYHVSRTDISVGNTFDLMKIDDLDGSVSADGHYTVTEFRDRLKLDFPHGITKHGHTYLFNPYNYIKNEHGTSFIVYQPMIETTFEMVRQGHYSDQPSRFTSVFGVCTIEEANALKAKYFDGQGMIFKVSCERFWKKDMSLLYTGGSFAGNIILARKYWEGNSLQNPFWEVLMAPPVQVIEKIV